VKNESEYITNFIRILYTNNLDYNLYALDRGITRWGNECGLRTQLVILRIILLLNFADIEFPINNFKYILKFENLINYRSTCTESKISRSSMAHRRQEEQTCQFSVLTRFTQWQQTLCVDKRSISSYKISNYWKKEQKIFLRQ